MVQTKDAVKAGTTEYQAAACVITRLADPEKWGNTGLQGCDEDWNYSKTYKSKAPAVRWLRERAQELGDDFGHGSVDRVEWTAENFHDDEYGYVHDASSETVRRWVYVWGPEEGLVLDDEYDPRMP